MNTVVILDHDSVSIEGCKRMLAASQGDIDYKFFQEPEKAVEYVRNYPVAVLLSELEMPVMSGKEVFDMVEILSPSTVRIAMAQVKDVEHTLEIFNQARIFKMIVKPFFLVEDILGPIQEALKYHEVWKKTEDQRQKMERELEQLNQSIQQLSEKLEDKKRKHDGIYHVAVGVIKGNLGSEIEELDAQDSSYTSAACEELLQEFMRYYMYEEHEYQFHVKHMQNLFHHPEEGCIFQVQNKVGNELPSDVMAKVAYGMFLGGYLCQQILMSYRIIMMVEREGNFYVLRMFCQHPGKNNRYKITNEKVRTLLKNVTAEIAKSLSDHLVTGIKEQQFAVKAYFRKEGGHSE